jgi:hypothetical protein
MFRLSRKLVMIIGGVALLMGSSGVFALYIGRDRLLGPSASSTNGMKCTDVNLVTIRKNNHVWLRKYITSDAADGLTRVRTALRVAKAVYDAQKPDLVQVVVLDKKGPTLQSDIHGRALGATVVYVPHPEKVADGTVDAPITARYYDGGASAEGLFYGERVDMTTADIDRTMAGLNDHSDCADPVTTEAAKAPEGGKHPKKKPAEDVVVKADVAADKAAEPESPPVQNPPPSNDLKPEKGSTGSFIGVSTDTAEKPQPQRDAEAAPVAAASGAKADTALPRPPVDPQTTGANQ